MSPWESPIPPRPPLLRASVLILALTAIAAVAAREGEEAARGDWSVPRTEHGAPDLQGNWTNATLTPLQRPRGQPAVLTDEEAATLERGQALDVAQGSLPSDPDREAPEAGGTDPICIDGPTSCYNEVYREPGELVARVRGEPRSSLITSPEDGRVPELTAAGRARVEASREDRAGFGPYDHPELRPLGERCIVSFGSNMGPPMLPNYWYNNNYTIVQNEDHILIMSEMVHDVRIIRLGDRRPLPPDVRPWFGDSWGHWEGETLVVETRNLNPALSFQGVPPSAETRVLERFTRVDEDTILYEFTLDDPGAYAEPWGGEVPFERFDDRLYEYACHEGNYAMTNVLRGARFEEQRGGDR